MTSVPATAFPFYPPGEEHVAMAPPRDREAPSLDASRLTYPLTMVILIVSIAGGGFTFSARLDVIGAKIDAQREVDAERAKTRTIELDTLKSSVEALTVSLKEMRSLQEMYNLQIAEIKSTIDQQRR